jgi:hypothetical protein
VTYSVFEHVQKKVAMLIRGALAAVWGYQGIWCKVMGRDRRHLAIAEAARMGWAVPAIGITEAALAIWVLTGWLPMAAAAVQTALIVAMNIGGLWRGRRWISDPGAMVTQNAAFLALAWVAAGVLHAR